jgi:nicotinamide-nucleotide adenylyltransferase
MGILKNKNMKENNVLTGVILARMQPVHNGHLALIKKACSENNEVYIFVGSADKFNKRNPLPIGLRLQLIDEAIDGLAERYDCAVNVIPLDDLTDENDNSHDWGFYLYSKIVTETGNPNFTIYYSDGYEIITTWFPGFILRNNVSLSLLARNSIEGGISATSVRDMIVNEKDEELAKHVPECVYSLRKSIKQHIELANLIKE